MAGVGDYIKGGVDDLKKAPAPMIVGLLLTGIVGAISLGALSSILTTGYNKLIYRVKRGEQASIGDVFSRFDKDAFMIGVPVFALSFIGLAIQFLVSPGLGSIISLVANLVALVLLWAAPHQAIKGGAFMDSIMASVDLWKKNPVGNLITVVVAGIVGVLGVVACGIGALVTMPIAVAAIQAAFLDQTGMLPAPAAPAQVTATA
jgi:hypothetical protein